MNDPSTAVQAIDRLAVLFGARRPGGSETTWAVMPMEPCGASCVDGGFAETLGIRVGPIRRDGAAERTVAQALLRLLTTCAALAIDDPRRWADIEEQAQLVVADAGGRSRSPTIWRPSTRGPRTSPRCSTRAAAAERRREPIGGTALAPRQAPT